ncbi:hypothetical protein D9V35_08685 [Commensalibacter melissae]|nr:hypothetical protein D9V35_08685 [Commensalibacter melissae]
MFSIHANSSWINNSRNYSNNGNEYDILIVGKRLIILSQMAINNLAITPDFYKLLTNWFDLAEDVNIIKTIMRFI